MTQMFGIDVVLVMGVTDIDDKIIRRADQVHSVPIWVKEETAHNFLCLCFYRRQTKLRDGNVFTGACLSSCWCGSEWGSHMTIIHDTMVLGATPLSPYHTWDLPHCY